MQAWTVASSLLGGALIGAAATWMYAAHRRVAGVSGMFQRALLPDGQPRGLDAAFLVGIALAGAAVRALDRAVTSHHDASSGDAVRA